MRQTNFINFVLGWFTFLIISMISFSQFRPCVFTKYAMLWNMVEVLDLIMVIIFDDPVEGRVHRRGRTYPSHSTKVPFSMFRLVYVLTLWRFLSVPYRSSPFPKTLGPSN